MNMSTSECSSACESGWTMYLDQSQDSGDDKCDQHHKGGYNTKWPNVGVEQMEEDHDEDSSMVSDASSGPRQNIQEDEGYFGYYDSEERTKATKERRKTRLNKEKRCKDVDDTASSTVFTCISKKDEASMEHDMGLSKQLKAKSGLSEKATSVASEKSGAGGLQTRKWV